MLAHLQWVDVVRGHRVDAQAVEGLNVHSVQVHRRRHGEEILAKRSVSQLIRYHTRVEGCFAHLPSVRLLLGTGFSAVVAEVSNVIFGPCMVTKQLRRVKDMCRCCW